MRTRRWYWMLLLILALALTGCGFGGPPTLNSITLAKKLDGDQKPIDPVSSFGPQDQIALSLQALNMEQGAKVKAIFLYGEEQLDEAQVTLDDGGSRYVGFTLPPGDQGWPGGDGYHIDIYLNGEKKQTVSYTIDAPAPNPRVTAITLTHKLDSKDRATDKVTEFKPEDDFYASVEVADLKKGQQVKGRWFQGQKELDSAAADIEGFTHEGFVSFSLKPEKTFPPGDYRLEVLIDGKLSKTTRFVVAAPVAELLESTMSHDIAQDDGAPVGKTDTFAGDQTIYYVATFNPLPKGTKLEAHWFQGDHQINSFKYEEQDGYDDNVFFHFQFTPDKDNPLPAGEGYRIDVYRDGEKIDTLPFSVLAPGPFGAIHFSYEIAPDTDAPIAEAAEYAYGTAIVYASFSFSDMQDKTPWSWIWKSPGNDPVRGDSEWNHGVDGTTWVRLTNPDGITPGEYSLELLVQDKVVQTGQVLVHDKDNGDFAQVPADYQPYESEKFGVSAAHPPDWKAEESENLISFSAPDGSGLVFLSVLEAGDQDAKTISDKFIAEFGKDVEEDDQTLPSVKLGGDTTDWRGFSLVQDGKTYHGNVGVARQGSKAHIFLNMYELSDKGVAANLAAWSVAASYSVK